MCLKSVEANRRSSILFGISSATKTQSPCIHIQHLQFDNCVPLAKLFVIVAIVVGGQKNGNHVQASVWAPHIKALEAHCICLLIWKFY